MEDPINRGLPFHLGEQWMDILAIQHEDEKPSIFPTLDTSLTPLEQLKNDDLPQLDLDLVIPELGQLEPDEKEVEESFKTPANGEAEAGAADPPLDEDPWDLEGILNQDYESKLCTWEAFEKKGVLNSERSGLLSEAGPGAFDAAINLLPKLRNEVGVFPQDYTLRTLGNLALGRSSTLFQWDPKERKFAQTIEGAAVTGVSRLCLESFAEEFVALGSMIVKLRGFSERRGGGSAAMALRSCVASLLNAVDESISGQLSAVRSMLQLQSLVEVPRRLLGILRTLVEAARDCESDESIISTISDRVYEESQTQYDLCPVLRTLLARVSVPWLERLATDLGFCSVQTALAAGNTTMDDDLKGLEESVSFVTPEDKQLIKETKQAVKILRGQEADHVLLQGDERAFACLTDPTWEGDDIAEACETYERRVVGHMTTNSSSLSRSARFQEPPVEPLDDEIWIDATAQYAFLQRSTALMSDHVGVRVERPTDVLHERALSICQDAQQHSLEADILELASDLSTTPLERVRALIQTQNKLVNGVLLRRLFREHNLRQHLELQRSFQLFGNGDFIVRLSTALFSQDTQSAERSRGAQLTGEIMGLRLGTTHEERWPPASSELQLTLMGILNEVHWKHRTKRSARTARDEPLPGSLSFAIRQLPEAEIDRVLDPNSIYALDFLRLQYTSVAPLDAILTTGALENYDHMFRFLMRLLRTIYVTTHLHKGSVLRNDEAACKFAHEANHFVSVLMSHTMELGIDSPWRTFMKSVDDLTKTLMREDDDKVMGTKTHVGVEGLRQLHDSCLERIRNRLFLRRKQEKVRIALENALTAILKASFALQRADPAVRGNFVEGCKDFQQSAKQACVLLREIVDKPLKTINTSESEDAEAMKILLTRLNWNGVYG